MQDEQKPGVSLGKRQDLDEPERGDGIVGAPPTGRSGSSMSTMTKTLGTILVIVVLMSILVLARPRHDAAPPPPAAQPVVVEKTGHMAEPLAEPDPPVNPVAEEEVDYRERARVKICRALARQLLEPSSPTREQQDRTLMIYNVNGCSKGFIVDAYAEKIDLTKEEKKALDEETEFGDLRVEDK